MFEVEQISKWPTGKDVTEWKVLTKKVIRTLRECEAPDLIGHIDALNNSRPRIIRGIALTNVIVLQARTRLLFDYLTT